MFLPFARIFQRGGSSFGLSKSSLFIWFSFGLLSVGIVMLVGSSLIMMRQELERSVVVPPLVVLQPSPPPSLSNTTSSGATLASSSAVSLLNLALLNSSSSASLSAQVVATFPAYGVPRPPTPKPTPKPVPTPPPVQVNNTLPGNGYSRQAVKTDVGIFTVDLIAGDLNTTRVQVETASNSDCGNNCPVDTLADYVQRSGGYAGVNGPYFCPVDYPSCAGKTNSFDTLLMNKNKVYFNSDNNVYSTVPAVIFSGTSVRWVGRSLEWGRDTGVDAVIANQPLIVQNGQVSFNGDGDPKKGSIGTRAFIGNKGDHVYIGVAHSVTVAEMGHVLQALGMDNALNLDSGGSIALYLNGRYLDGPGRQTPFGIVLVRM